MRGPTLDRSLPRPAVRLTIWLRSIPPRRSPPPDVPDRSQPDTRPARVDRAGLAPVRRDDGGVANLMPSPADLGRGDGPGLHRAPPSAGQLCRRLGVTDRRRAPREASEAETLGSADADAARRDPSGTHWGQAPATLLKIGSGERIRRSPCRPEGARERSRGIEAWPDCRC